MTARELATLLHAKPLRRGQWVAKCPCHREKTASLSIRDMGNRMAVKCFGCGATGRDVMKQLGLPASAVFVDKRTITPELRAVLRNEERLRSLQKKELDCIMKQYFVEPERREYWSGLEAKTKREITAHLEMMYPERKEYRERKAKLDKFVNRHGWDKLWELFLESDRGKAEAEQWSN